LTSPIVESEKIRAHRILQTLRENIAIRDEDFASLRVAKEKPDPFRILAVTILSQNCTDVASLRAFHTLDRQLGVNASNLSRAKPSKIAKAIHDAGLHKQKARALKHLSRILMDRHHGTLDDILNQPLDQARSLLQELPKVGPKTADVLLSVLGQSTISVDTHVDRVSKRLGLVRQKARYEETRASLMALFPPEDYRTVPLLFMAFGRKICKAPKPRCFECPVERLCPYPSKTLR
jgi:endonuclease-3